MGFDQSATDEIDGQDISPASVSTDDLNIDGSDFVSSGDVLPLAVYGTHAARDVSVSNASYQDARDIGLFFLDWDTTYPTNATTVVRMEGMLDAGTDETITGRFRNTVDGETVVSASTSNSFDQISTSWSQYDPTTSDPELRYQHKTDPASNSSTTLVMYLVVGIQL